MYGNLALPTLIVLWFIAIGRTMLGSMAMLGESNVSSTLMKVDELANVIA